MKLRIHGTFLGLFLALGLFISFAAEAPAHEYRNHGSEGDRKAEEVDINDKAQMKEFLEHVVEHFNQIQDDPDPKLDKNTELTIIGRRYREEGVFYHKATNVYSMGVNQRGSITSHPAHPQLYGQMINFDAAGSYIAAAVDAIVKRSTPTEAACEQYTTRGGEQRVACGKKVDSTTGTVTTIVGLHHEDDDSAIIFPALCDDLKLQTTAKDVYDDPTDANLQAYVKNIIEVAQNQVLEINTNVFLADPVLGGKAQQGDPQALQKFGVKVFERMYDIVACFGNSPDTKYENIYAFVMGTDPAGTVLLNGNNFGLIGLDLLVDDDELPGEDKSIAGLFRNALTKGSGEPQDGQNAFVDYRWDDPSTTEDNIDNWFVDKSVPGNSPKRSYIEVANLNEKLPPPTPPMLYIFGSGVYGAAPPPGPIPVPADDDDGGCAIAGAGHASQGALLGLFLTAALVFSVAFLRKRA